MPNETAGKQAVSNLDASLPDDDDDIVDLLEVVKPGKPVAGQSGDTAADFEAMLHKLSDDVEGGGEAPFPDPNPVDYTVDHNEELELPDMTDVDALLETLGESGRGAGSQERAPGPPAGGDAQAALTQDASVEDLDAMPLGGRDDLPESVTLDDDFLADLGGGFEAGAADKSAEGASDLDLDINALLGEAPAAPEKPAQKKISPTMQPKAAPDKNPKAPPAVETPKAEASRDEVDLNELDALLDDVLAGAPAAADAPAQDEDVDALLDAAQDMPESGGTVRQQDIDDLRGALHSMEAGLRDAIAANRKGVENDLAATLGRAVTAETTSEELKGLVAKQGSSLESQGTKLEAAAKSLADISARLTKLEQTQAALGEGKTALEALNKDHKAAVERLKKLEQTQIAPDDSKAALEALDKNIKAAVERLSKLEQSPKAPGEDKTALEALDKAQKAADARLEKLEQAQTTPGDSKAALEALDKDLKAAVERLSKLEQSPKAPGEDKTALEALDKAQKAADARLEKLEQAQASPGDSKAAIEALDKDLKAAVERLSKLEQSQKAAGDGKAALEALDKAHKAAVERLNKLEQAQAALGEGKTALEALDKDHKADEARLDALEQEQARLAGRFQEVEQTLVGHSETAKGLESALAEKTAALESLRQTQSELDARLDKLEQSGEGESLKELTAGMPLMQSRLDGVEQSLAEQIGRLKKVENAANAHLARAGETDAQLAEYLKTVREMAQNQSVFSDRLGALEQKLAAAPSLESLEALERKFADLEAGMEKAAAAAAAKVIREEIGALLGA